MFNFRSFYADKNSVAIYFAQVFRVLSSGFFALVLTKFLSAQEVAIWYRTLALLGGLIALDFGFIHVLTRNLTYFSALVADFPFTVFVAIFRYFPVFLVVTGLFVVGCCVIFFNFDGFGGIEPSSLLLLVISFLLYFSSNVLVGGFSALGMVWVFQVSSIFQSIVLCLVLMVIAFVPDKFFIVLLAFFLGHLCNFSYLLYKVFELRLQKPDTLSLDLQFSLLFRETLKSIPAIVSFQILVNFNTVFFFELLPEDIFASFGLSLQVLNIVGAFVSTRFLVHNFRFTSLVGSADLNSAFSAFFFPSIRSIFIFWSVSLSFFFIGSFVFDLIAANVRFLSFGNFSLFLFLTGLELWSGFLSQFLLANKRFFVNYLLFVYTLIYLACLVSPWVRGFESFAFFVVTRLVLVTSLYIVPQVFLLRQLMRRF